MPTIRALLEAAHIAGAACGDCPAEGAVRAMAPDEPPVYLIAAE